MDGNAENETKQRTRQNIRGVMHPHGDASQGNEQRPKCQRKPNGEWATEKRQRGDQRRPRRVTGGEGVRVGFSVDCSPVSLWAAAAYREFGRHNQDRENEDGGDEANR